MFKYKTAYFCANAKLSTQVATPVVNGCLTLGLLMSVLPVGALAADPSEVRFAEF